MNQVIVKPSPNASSRQTAVNPESEQGIKLRVRRSLAMHRTLAAVVTVVVAIAIIIFGLMRKPMYLAQSLIYIQPTTPQSLTDVTPERYDSARYDSYISQQLETIVRDDILGEALKKLPDGMWRNPGESEESAISRLRAQLKAQRVQSTYNVEISLKGADPFVVTRVVNEVAAAFLKSGRGDELAQSGQELQLLIADRERILDALSKARLEQAKLSSRLGVADTSSENTGNPYDAQLQDLRRQVFAARQAHFVALSQLQAVSKGSQSPDMMNSISDETASSDPALSALKSSISQRRSALVAQMADMTPANPLYKQDQQELARLDESLASVSQGARAKTSQQLVNKWNLEAAKTAEVQAELENQLAQQTSLATSAAPKLQRASDITSDIARLQAHFTETDNAIHSLQLQESSSGLAHLSLAAVQPQKPAPSNKPIIFAMAFPLAFFCGVAAAVVVQKLDHHVYIAEDIESALRFPPMAVLPDPDDVDTHVMDEFLLRLVAAIDQAHRVGEAKTFVFTAASPSMNTSSIVELLAKKVSAIGYQVAVSKASAALKSAKDNSDVVNEERGLVAIGGETYHAPTPDADDHTYASGHVMQTSRSVDMIFIDARPILASAEAEFETRLVDVTVLLANSGLTTRNELVSSLALIRRLTSQGVGAVLLNLRLRHADKNFLSAVHNAEAAVS